jgi:tRNA(Ile)-lysidine synthase
MSFLEKENTWVLLTKEKIVWVVGYRIDERFSVNDNTKEVLEIKFK